jgi:hypothetical protein
MHLNAQINDHPKGTLKGNSRATNTAPDRAPQPVAIWDSPNSTAFLNRIEERCGHDRSLFDCLVLPTSSPKG